MLSVIASLLAQLLLSVPVPTTVLEVLDRSDLNIQILPLLATEDLLVV